jgi:hypothetical protein
VVVEVVAGLLVLEMRDSGSTATRRRISRTCNRAARCGIGSRQLLGMNGELASFAALERQGMPEEFLVHRFDEIDHMGGIHFC